MDALLTTFLAAALAEFGDKTQLLAMALAVRYGRPAPIVAGLAVGALVNSLIAAAGGVLLHELVTPRAVSLLVALALVFAGVAGFIGRDTPKFGTGWKIGAFPAAAAGFFLAEFGDKTQFLTGALAAQFNTLALAAAGAAAGVVAANLPAVVLAETFGANLPMRGLRIVVAILFLLVGFFVAINALRLI